MPRILITGADGFVGRALTARLLAAGSEVVGVARTHGGDGTVAVGDICDYGEWPSLLADVDVVVHLAARAHVLQETHANPLEAFRRINVAATERIARAAAASGVRRFVFLSSIGVNGIATTGRAFCESDVPNPSEPYAISKWEAEQLLMEIGARTGMEITRVRPPLIVGPGAKGNLRRLVRLVDSGIPLPFGNVQSLRSFVGLEDLCELLTSCCMNARAADELFLAADVEELSLVDLLGEISKSMGRKPRLIAVPMWALRLGGRLVGVQEELQRMTSSLRVNAKRARERLEWQPGIGLREAIRKMVQSYLREK